MHKTLLCLVGAAALLAPCASLAGPAKRAAIGAGAGAVVAGPVGAVAGAGAGAVMNPSRRHHVVHSRHHARRHR